ncbi:MAG: FecR domain-containing protein, partial [Spirochaetota bacterium]|nr:FecR domain-containing protein [Spirochaetota bacterium]
MKYTIFFTINLLLFSSLVFSGDISGDYKKITVQQNENLGALADRYLKSKRFTSDLLRYNRLTENLIRPGLTIKVPHDISKERVAKVKFLKGKAIRTSALGQQEIRRSGIVLLKDELVRTGAKSQLELQFDDGSLIQLSEKSSISLKQFTYARNGR